MHKLKKVTGLVVLSLALLLVACGGGAEEEVGEQELPTQAEAEDVGREASGSAANSAQGTWDNYLRDQIAEQNRIRDITVNLIQRYQDPEITGQSNRLLLSINLREDRSEVSETFVNADFDVQVEYLNGDTETLTCTYRVDFRIVGADENAVYYVNNPAPLQVFSQCN